MQNMLAVLPYADPLSAEYKEFARIYSSEQPNPDFYPSSLSSSPTLRAALAHERGHIEGGHLILSSGFLAALFLAKSLFGALGLPMTLALLLVYLALLRRNELDADRRAAALAGPGDLVRLLLNLKSKLKEPACLDWPGMSVLSTHPGFRVRAARVLGTSARSLS
jgi:Zn-dependent protease with chaperone function